MQVSLEVTSNLERKMRISVPATEVDAKVEQKIKETAGQVRLKGFRPGKVPVREVRRRFGDGIRQEVSSELMQSSYSAALAQESVSPAGTPRIEDVSIGAGKDLEFTAIFEVFPEITVGDLARITIERPVADITDDDIDRMVEKLRDQRKTFADVDREAGDGDQVVIDFEGFIDGEAFDGGKAAGVDLVLGSGSMIDGFEAQLTGARAGEDRELAVTFPETYHAENLKGKAATFKVRVNAVKEPTLPALDDAFYAEFGVKDGGVEAFRTEVRGNMARELKTAVKNKVRSQVMDGLLEITEVEVPRSLVAAEVDRMRQDAVQRFGGGRNLDPSLLPAEMFEAQAEPRVKLGLIVNAIVEQQGIRVDEARVRSTIEDMASTYEQPEMVVNYYYSNQQQLEQVRNMVLEEQVIETILDSASVSEKVQSYDDAVKPAPADDPAADGDDESSQETGVNA